MESVFIERSHILSFTPTDLAHIESDKVVCRIKKQLYPRPFTGTFEPLFKKYFLVTRQIFSHILHTFAFEMDPFNFGTL